MDIQDKVVIITGASEGIGLATAHLFAEAGAKVALAARSADTLTTIGNELHEQHREALAVPTDMRNKDAIESLVDSVFQQYGRIDILINKSLGVCSSAIVRMLFAKAPVHSCMYPILPHQNR